MKKVKTWRDINAELVDANEQRCKEMLDEERNGENRQLFVIRIYGRYAKLRAARERKEMRI
jgi:hypothetical protein